MSHTINFKKLVSDTVAKRVLENQEGTITQEVVAHLLLKVQRHLSDEDMAKLVAVSKVFLLEKRIAKRYLWLLPYLDTSTHQVMRDNLQRLEQDLAV